MKISLDSELNGFYFKDIEIGDCFIHNRELYLKLRDNETQDNTFCLTTNEVLKFDLNTRVIFKKMTLQEI